MSQAHGVFGKYGVMIEHYYNVTKNNILNTARLKLNTNGAADLWQAFSAGAAGYGPGYLPNPDGLLDFTGRKVVRSYLWCKSYSRYPYRVGLTHTQTTTFNMPSALTEPGTFCITFMAIHPNRASHRYHYGGKMDAKIEVYKGGVVVQTHEISNAIWMAREAFRRAVKRNGIEIAHNDVAVNYNYQNDKIWKIDVGNVLGADRLVVTTVWYHGKDELHDVGDRSPDKSWNGSTLWGEYYKVNANLLPFDNYTHSPN